MGVRERARSRVCDCRSRKNVTCSWSRSRFLPLAAWFLLPSLFDANAYASNDAAVLRIALEHFAKHEWNLAKHKEAKTLIVVNDQTEGLSV